VTAADPAGHSGQAHAHVKVSADTDSRRLTSALALILAFIAAEVAAGIPSSPLRSLERSSSQQWEQQGPCSCESFIALS
jgi:hypothetical protein